MKKVIALMIVMLLLLTGCNYKFVDTNWTFNYAYITFPDGSIKEVEVKKWAEDSTSITIQSRDGNIYCVSMHNCVLTRDQWEGYVK